MNASPDPNDNPTSPKRDNLHESPVIREGLVGLQGIPRFVVVFVFVILTAGAGLLIVVGDNTRLLGLMMLLLGLPTLVFLFLIWYRGAEHKAKREQLRQEMKGELVELIVTVYQNGDTTDWVEGAEVRFQSKDAYRDTTDSTGRVKFNYPASYVAENQYATVTAFKAGVGKGKSGSIRLALQNTPIEIELIPNIVPDDNTNEGNLQSPHSTESHSINESIGSIEPNSKKRIFISYKRNVDPDERIARYIYEAFARHHQVFIDREMPIGVDWAARIEQELKESDFLITFLSRYSVNSEMVKGEIETAHHLAKEQGKPRILPVRIAFDDPLHYPLSAYLNSINWGIWENEQDTVSLFNALERAVSGDHSGLVEDKPIKHVRLVSGEEIIPEPVSAAQMELPEGTMNPESKFYIVRASDTLALNSFRLNNGITIPIKGPRQIGKSSLLMRLVQQGIELGKRAAFVDFQIFDKSIKSSADAFYYQFCAEITSKLGLPPHLDYYLNNKLLSNNQRCRNYMESYVLPELNGKIILAMDEVDCIFNTDFQSDFFGMLRNWHNSRAENPNLWRQFDLLLVTSTEPYLFIEDINMSPFNVGLVTTLSDFSFREVEELARRYGNDTKSEIINEWVKLFSGHPYLTRRAFYLMASKYISYDELMSNASHDRGPFGEHLRYQLYKLRGSKALISGLKETLSVNRCTDEMTRTRLIGAGLIRQVSKTDDNLVDFRCDLYRDYFFGKIR